MTVTAVTFGLASATALSRCKRFKGTEHDIQPRVFTTLHVQRAVSVYEGYKQSGLLVFILAHHIHPGR